jgi:predicted DNA-binding transcriptional regulator AlpA
MLDKARRPEDVATRPESGRPLRRSRRDRRWIKAALTRHSAVEASPNQAVVPGAPSVSTTDIGMERHSLIGSLLANAAVSVDIPLHQIPSIVAELTAQQAAILTALGILTTRIVVQQPVPAETGDRLLTADEVAEALGVTKRWVQRRARRLPFARRLSEHAVRYSEGGLRRWMEHRRMRVA